MKLNEQQISAVNHITGPLLILAGAGSGKTRVLTERIANLITNLGIHPYNILAVTFTNKAAKEMKERISSRIGEDKAKSLWIGTFHSICSRILRAEIHLLNRNSNFVIYDSADQTKLITECLKKLNIDDKNYPPAKVLKEISKAKSSGFSSENYITNNLDYRSQKTGEIYMMYEAELKKNNALDFDDMLFYVVKIFNEHEDRLQHYQKKFKYIMVDEYQDTNQIQYMLITMLAGMYQNICVVGDVDQSIYSFRNADFRIILNFQKDYPNAEIIKLETNYRSTKNIVALSNEIIKENKERFPKNLNTDNTSGDKIRIYEASDDEEEVRFIIREMYRLIEKGYDYNDFTVLYRTNAQSRVFEEYFVRNNIPHQIIGGFRFFERKEIKDLLSYLKFIFNPYDSLSLQRIINTPKRGIGSTTIEKLMDLANHFNLPLWDILNFQTFDNISPATQRTIKEFVFLMNKLMELSTVVSVSKLIKEILEQTNYITELQKEDEKESKDKNRTENVYQLINSANDFEINSDDVSLEAYLNYISLLSDTDSIDGESNHVKLMTIHTSKGLEFPVVFVAGVAEGLFPHANSASTYEIEEERRLMYVAVTRAQKVLYLTFPRKRNMFGSTQHHVASRFISECPPELVYGYNTDKVYNDKIYGASPYNNQNRSYQEKAYYQNNYNNDYAETSFKKKRSSYDEFLDEDFSGRNSFEKREKTSKKLDTFAIQKELEKRYSNTSNTSNGKSFREGQRIENDKWGLGTITKVMKNKEKTILIINFDDIGGSKILDPNLSKIHFI